MAVSKIRKENMRNTFCIVYIIILLYLQQGLKTSSYLLEKLLATYNLNTLIINLYPGNKGYSLSLKINGNTQYLHPPDANVSIV